MDENRMERTIPCYDAGDRPRSLVVVGAPGSVTLTPPPGEFARIEPDNVEALKTALTDALVFACRS